MHCYKLQFALALLLLFGWSAVCADSDDVLDKRLKSIAGDAAVDCGSVQIRENAKPASQCAAKAFSAKQSFIVRYWLQGIDSQVGVALAGTKSGQVFTIEFDSMGWSPEGLGKNAQLLDGSHNIVQECPAPVRLRETASGRLSCFPPNPKAHGNIMSPSAEPY